MKRMSNDGIVYGGMIATDGEVLKVGVGVRGTQSGTDRNEKGIFLLNQAETFELQLANPTGRKVMIRVTGDDDSTVIAESLVLPAVQTVSLRRWQTTDAAFIAYARNSAEGQAVGADEVSEGGGGLIKVQFTFGTFDRPQPVLLSFDGGLTRGASLHSFGASQGVTRGFEEGVMGSGSSTGQTFGRTSFTEDADVPPVEIQVRWAIRRPTPPPDRRPRRSGLPGSETHVTVPAPPLS
ncbi:MAG: hypothetical protein SFT92_08635 [Rickettsiales bacterium]|nr:hypothetical protein [Rickettsiales bacterium]